MVDSALPLCELMYYFSHYCDLTRSNLGGRLGLGAELEGVVYQYREAVSGQSMRLLAHITVDQEAEARECIA